MPKAITVPADLAAAGRPRTPDPMSRVVNAVLRDDRPALAQAAADVFASQGDWRHWAQAVWLTPWGEPAREMQARSDARVRAQQVGQRRGDPVRREVARVALLLLRQGIGGHDLLKRLDAYNAALPEPLKTDVLDQTALWAAQHIAKAYRHVS